MTKHKTTAKPTFRAQVRRLERLHGTYLGRRVWIEAVAEARKHHARNWGVSPES